VTAEFTLNKGGVLRIRRFDEQGAPEVVSVSAELARRCVFLRLQYLGGGAADVPEMLCAVFQDTKTGEVYAAPLEEPS
jgi:hypothetical protein